MSAHLYNLGADMNVSSGMDRLGKVVFWLSLLASTTVAVLLGMSSVTPEKHGWLLGFLNLGVLLASYLRHSRASTNPPVSVWGGAILFIYNVAYTSLVMNKLPSMGSELMLVAYFAPIATFFILKAIARYILQGFTQKT